jgi:hypothetical protein
MFRQKIHKLCFVTGGAGKSTGKTDDGDILPWRALVSHFAHVPSLLSDSKWGAGRNVEIINLPRLDERGGSDNLHGAYK